MAASHPLHPRRRIGGQASEVGIGVVEREQRVILALNDERRCLDLRQNALQTRLIQQLAQLVVRYAGLSCVEIAPTHLGGESTAELISARGCLVSCCWSSAAVGEQQCSPSLFEHAQAVR